MDSWAQAPKGVVVAGTHSGCGKTTVSLALMAAYARRSVTVQPFKVGPDFIDPGLHRAATGRASHNLDGWMLGYDRCRSIYARHSWDVELTIVEGVMGLFDGASGADETGSTAEMAKWLGMPVLLVVDASSMARSVAALVQGFATYDPDLRLAGVVFNRVGGERHRELIWEAMTRCPKCQGIPILGFMPRSEGLELPERHLGLHTAEEGALTQGRIDALVAWVEKHIELSRLLQLLPRPALVDAADSDTPPRYNVRIGVARDRAFCFYYPENLRILEACGAELVFFSPMEDASLPENLDGLYLGGGYPELYAARLSSNREMRRAVHSFARAGKPVYAECGGFMYLMDELQTEDGPFPMTGVFAMQCVMNSGLRSLGYREIVTRRASLLGPAWTMLRGHEFHYSHRAGEDERVSCIYKVMDRRGWLPCPEGYMRDNVLGSYIHLHFGSNPAAAASFVAACAGEFPRDRDAD